MTWDQIGAQLGYSGNVVEQDLRQSIKRSNINLCLVASPELRRRIALDYNGSVTAFLRGIRYPVNAGRRELAGKDPYSDRLRAAVKAAVGIDPAEGGDAT